MFKGIIAIYKKEIKAYFYSSIAYVFLILFILISNIIFFYFFGGIFKENSATMRRFFSILPYIFIIFIPGLTMGSWEKEKNAGTIEGKTDDKTKKKQTDTRTIQNLCQFSKNQFSQISSL